MRTKRTDASERVKREQKTAEWNKEMSRTTCRNGFIFVAAMCLGLMVTSARGGSLDDTGAPTDPVSAMYTAKDLYNRLAFGTNAPKRAGAFTEPTAGPTAGTMPTTDDIMAKAPATNVSGAVDGAVLSGKTFWGLTQGAWGMRTGTIATATLSPANDTVSNGYYLATTLHAVDPDLATNNIRSGVTIFGFAGDSNMVNTSSGNAVAGDVKSGQVAWVQGAAVTGTIATVTLSGTTTNMAAGYYAATNLAQVATNLATANIKAGMTIFGVTGKTEVVDTTSGNAVAGDVNSGQVAWVQGAAVTGTIETVTLSGTTTNMAAGYYAATNLALVATNLAVGNIKKDMNIFGVVGTYEGSGVSVTNAPVPKTGQTNSYANYDDGWYSTNKGAAWPNPRFSPVGASGEETNQIRDNLTGLIWARNADLAGWTMDWQGALDYITYTINVSEPFYGGTNDWRLPNLRELFSLIHFGTNSPALCDTEGTAQWTEGNPFTDVQSSEYWTSSAYSYDLNNRWSVRLSDGEVSRTSILGGCYVWPVRGP